MKINLGYHRMREKDAGVDFGEDFVGVVIVVVVVMNGVENFVDADGGDYVVENGGYDDYFDLLGSKKMNEHNPALKVSKVLKFDDVVTLQYNGDYYVVLVDDDLKEQL